MSGATPNAMPPLPRLPPGLPAALVGAWNQLCNAIELQMRRLLAQTTISTVPQVGQTATAGTPYQIASTFVELSTVGASGVAFLPATIGSGLLVNNGANTLILKPQSGATINGGSSVNVNSGAQVWWSVSSATVTNAH